MKRQKPNKASMLIVALGILTLLSVLAVTFAMLMMLEHKAAKNYVDGVRANFLATSGREAAVISLKNSITDPSIITKQTLKGRYPWIYNLGDYSIPLEQALTEKFPSNIVSYYGDLGRTYEEGLDHFGAKIIDTSSQFNINNRFMVTQKAGGKIEDPIYHRILVNLGEAIKSYRGLTNNPIDSDVAKAILAFRNQLEGQEFTSKNQLLDVEGIEEDSYALIKDFITTRSWVDEKAVIASEETLPEKDPFSSTDDIPSISYRLSSRSPININTASKEILTAVTTGIGGRTVFTYNEVDVTNSANRQIIDSQAKKWQMDTSSSVGQRHEAKKSSINSLYIWIEPFSLSEAAKITQAIMEKRKKNVFDNFQEFNTFIDRLFADQDPNVSGFFKSYWGRVGGGVLKRIADEIKSSSYNIRNPFNASMKTQLKQIYRKAAADCIKANFNPNATVSFFNPNTGAAKTVDKANLLYMAPFNTTGSGFTPGQVRVTQTVDFCFQPMGIFEITSLGQVKSKAKTEAEAKIRTLIWVYDALRHTTQADFESKSQIFGSALRFDVLTYPEPSVNWKVKKDGSWLGLSDGGIPSGANQQNANNTVIDGRVEIKEGNDTSSLGKANARWQARWNKRWTEYDSTYSNLYAERKAPEPQTWGYTYETRDVGVDELTHKNSSVQSKEGNLMPDGFYNSKFVAGINPNGYGPRYLWWRAGYFDPSPEKPYDDSSGSNQIEQGNYSNSSPPNINYYGGTLEFWYKPDKHWHYWDFSKNNSRYERPMDNPGAYNGGSRDVFMGFLFLSHVREKAKPDDKNQITTSTGTQLFLYRNPFGDLRATRIYYEIVGEDPSKPPFTHPEQPFIQIPKNQLSDKVKKYGDPKYFADGVKGLREYIKAYEIDPFIKGGTYKWPPMSIGAKGVGGGKLDNNIKRGRSDCLIYAEDLKYIRAHEWHHIKVTWDDNGDKAEERLQIDIDNGLLTSVPLPRLNENEFADTFTKLNEYPGKNRDHLYVGSIFREQFFYQSGIFKFNPPGNVIKEACHGTIDDVYYFPPNVGSKQIPQRFASVGRYTNAFELGDKFSGGIKNLQLGTLSWTGYLPRMWHKFPNLNPRMIVRYKVSKTGVNPGSVSAKLAEYSPSNFDKTGIVPLLDSKGDPLSVGAGQWFVYQFDLESASPAGASVQYVVTPSLDDVTLTYFLPQPKVLLESNIYQ